MIGWFDMMAVLGLTFAVHFVATENKWYLFNCLLWLGAALAGTAILRIRMPVPFS